MANILADGRRITLELTEEELATIVYATGITSTAELEEVAVGYGVPCLDSYEHYHLWERLMSFLSAKEAV